MPTPAFIRNRRATDLALQKYDGIIAPTVSNDTTEGFSVGSVWIDTVAAKAYRCFDASTGAAVWEEIGATGGSAGNVTNLARNGNFEIWQDGETLVAVGPATTSIFSADGYFYSWETGGTGVVTIDRDIADTPSGQNASYAIDVTTGDVAIAADHGYSIISSLEGFDTAQLDLGNSGAQAINVHFQVKATVTGIYSLTISNSAGNRAFVREYTVNVANTFEEKTIQFPGDVTGTWETGSLNGFSLIWAIAMGTDRQAAPNVYTATAPKASTNQVNGMNSGGNVFKLSDIRIGTSDNPDNYIKQTIDEQWAREQRYYQTSYDKNVAPGTTSDNGGVFFRANGTGHEQPVPFGTCMRTAPTMVTFATDSATPDNWGGTFSTLTINSLGQMGFRLSFTVTVDQSFMFGHYVADARI